MKPNFPPAVTLMEVGPRDGFQFEGPVVPTERKLAVIARLAAAGLARIQVAAFVHPRKVPQMADAERLIARLPQGDGVLYSALVLNPRGLERALASTIPAVEISLSASDAHSRDNAGLSHAAALAQGLAMIKRAVAAGRQVRAGIQCAFGCVTEGAIPAGRIAAIVQRFAALGPAEIALADTTGLATPPQVEALLDRVQPLAGPVPLALHLHDTRGLGLVNLMAALGRGVARFDTALGGMGGCPFVPGAAGNVATEEVCYLLAALGIATGVDLGRVAAVAREMERFFGKSFPGRMHRLAGSQDPA